MGIKITTPNGNYSIITTADQESRFGEFKIVHIWTKEPQPYIAVSFTGKGEYIAGRTLTDVQRDQAVRNGKNAGYIVESVSN